MTDQQAFDLLRDGDMTGLDAIYINNRTVFVRWMQRFARCTNEQAMDFYQEAILQFYKNVVAGTYVRTNTRIASYLIEIGKNKWRSAQRREWRETSNEPAVRQTFYEDRDPVDEAGHAALVQRLEQALAELGEPGSTLLRLYHQEGASYEEIVRRMGYDSVNSAKTQRYKFMLRLKSILFGQIQNKP